MKIDPSAILCVIPVRIGSTRFPRKPFAKILGKPMIEWVYHKTKNSGFETLVATDSAEIADFIKSIGGKVILTSKEHKNGTERVLEAAQIYAAETSKNVELIINVQGDEPLILSDAIKCLGETFDPDLHQIYTIGSPIVFDKELLLDRNDTFLVMDKFNKALYFSRLAIPYQIDQKPYQRKIRHIGIYAYAPQILAQIAKLTETELERLESQEQNRWLEHGKTIHVFLNEMNAPAVDCAEHIEKVENFLEENPEFKI